MAKTIHEASKFSRLRWALAFSAPFHESFKISSFDPWCSQKADLITSQTKLILLQKYLAFPVFSRRLSEKF